MLQENRVESRLRSQQNKRDSFFIEGTRLIWDKELSRSTIIRDSLTNLL